MCGTFVFENLHKQYILEVTIAEAGRGRCSNVVSDLCEDGRDSTVLLCLEKSFFGRVVYFCVS